MSNLAIGIALGSAMHSGSYFGSICEAGQIPPVIAWLLLLSLTICVATLIIQGYRGKISIFDELWEIWILGSLLGVCLWAVIVMVVGLFGWLISLVM